MNTTVLPDPHLPTQAFFERDLDLVPLDNVAHYRAYQTRHPDPLGFRATPSRFSDPQIEENDPKDVYATVYFGTSIETCVLEAIVRDSGLGRDVDVIPISRTYLESWSIVEIAASEPLALLDLRGSGTVANRIPTDAVRAQSHDLGRLWSQAIHNHKDQPDGIIFSSRLNEQPNVAVFGRAMPKLETVTNANLFAYRVELAAILDRYKIALV